MYRTRRLRCFEEVWKWALKGDEELLLKSREQHDRVCIFMDGIHLSRKIVNRVRPFADMIFRMRNKVSGDEVVTPDSMRHWNTAEEFIDGAQVAYRESLRLILEAPEGPLPASVFEPGVERPDLNFKTLDDIRFQGRFTHLGGPKSLEMLHTMTDEGFSTLYNRGDMQELGDVWRKELFNDSPMHLRLTFASIVDKEKKIRRCDRIVLTSTFNLSEGITSDFRVSEWTCVKQDPMHEEVVEPKTREKEEPKSEEKEKN